MINITAALLSFFSPDATLSSSSSSIRLNHRVNYTQLKYLYKDNALYYPAFLHDVIRTKGYLISNATTINVSFNNIIGATSKNWAIGLGGLMAFGRSASLTKVKINNKTYYGTKGLIVDESLVPLIGGYCQITSCSRESRYPKLLLINSKVLETQDSVSHHILHSIIPVALSLNIEVKICNTQDFNVQLFDYTPQKMVTLTEDINTYINDNKDFIKSYFISRENEFTV